MKIKRKLYPNSDDKEFVVMSVNDLITFGQCTYATIQGSPDGLLVSDIIRTYISSVLQLNGIKTPASHLKKTKKQKAEQENHG